MPLENVIDTLENCRFCLMCTHVAPVGNVTRLETYTPHGMALLATSERRGLAEWNPETASIVFAEVDGGNSRDHCVFDQPFEEAMAAVRAELVAAGQAPSAVAELRQRLEQYQTPYTDRAPEAASGEGEIALFVGDEGPYLWDTAVPAALELLQKVGVEPVLIGRGRNNGLLAHSAGLPDLAKQLAQATLHELHATGAKTLLVLSAGDYYAFTAALAERLGLALPDGVEAQELVSFLAGQLDLVETAVATDVPAAYVDPTHAVRAGGRHEAARALAAPLLGDAPRELFWRKERAQPVGSTYIRFTRPDIAEALTRARLADAQASGVKLLFGDDPATLHELSRFALEYGVEVLGLYESLAAV